MLTKIADLNVRYSRHVLAIFFIVFILSILGMMRLKVETNWIENFADHFRIKQDYKFVDEKMGGSQSFELVFEVAEDEGFKNPENLKEIDKFQSWLGTHKEITGTISLVDMVKQINMAFYEDDISYYRLPDNRPAIAQLLLLFEMSGSKDLKSLVTTNYKKIHLNVRTKNMSDENMDAIFTMMKMWQKTNMKKNIKMEITGTSALFLQTFRYVMTSQVQGFTLAFIVIGLMMIMLFRSFKIGLVSMLPNLFPIFFTLGFMGFANINLDVALMLNASIALGIAVDDTIHLFTRYEQAFRKNGEYVLSLYETFKDVGLALLFTSLILAVGYLVVSGSDMANVSMFGLIAGLTVVVAWIADMFLAPSLILFLKPFGKEKIHTEEPK